ncbi:phage tail assembly chaperone [Alkalihalobacillus trypoxylicola]|uniref:Phage portal protein n=1 Tax=Alkalihalobacillus trypoxylicola TaxID=519424 RepID=A0A161Q9B9_9BACI|nr:phage portal protein [Alkalihalobacillus trypoxylicola]KYG33893.1 phage portal protein [Alkalihalobacillus trypoxylicola]
MNKNNDNNLEQFVQDISIFMPGNYEEPQEMTAVISKRFKKNNEVIPFIFKAISTDRIDELEKDCTTFKNKKGVGRVKDFDAARFSARIAVETTVYPNFKSKEFTSAYKSPDPIDIAKTVLSVGGEYTNWINKAMEVNGFDEDLDELQELAKN